MADGGSIKVKLILDTTQYMEAIARAKAALAELATMSLKPRVCMCTLTAQCDTCRVIDDA